MPVVPRMGTWVEILAHLRKLFVGHVVPRMGTWVEIALCMTLCILLGVVPRMGTWVEIELDVDSARFLKGRPPHGDVG